MVEEELQVRVADLEYRVAELGGSHAVRENADLLRRYFEILRIPEPSETAARMLRVLLADITTADLHRIGRLTQDPMAWTDLVRVCSAVMEAGYDLEDVMVRLLLRVRSLLDAQGLQKVRPADLL
jgi:hypothetical protein